MKTVNANLNNTSIFISIKSVQGNSGDTNMIKVQSSFVITLSPINFLPLDQFTLERRRPSDRLEAVV